jgi:hypothetical protein
MTETTEVAKPDIGIASAGLSEGPVFGPGSDGIDAAVEAVVAKREALAQSGALPSGIADALTNDLMGGVNLNPELTVDEDAGLVDHKVGWQDPKQGPVSVSDAAKSYSAYRSARALEVLRSIDAAQKAEQEAALAAQQPPQASPEEEAAQRQAEEQARAQAEAQEAFERQKATELDAVRQQANGYAVALSALVANANNRALAEWADIRTEQDLVRLAQTDQPRLQRLQAHVAQVQQLQQEIGRVQQQQQAAHAAAYQESFRRFSEAEEKKVEALIPELREDANPVQRREHQQQAYQALTEAGFKDAELRAGWVDGQLFSLRDSRVQKIISDAARWQASQAKAQELSAHRKPPPSGALMKPGVAQSYGGMERAKENSMLDALPTMRGEAALSHAVNIIRSRRAQRG